MWPMKGRTLYHTLILSHVELRPLCAHTASDYKCTKVSAEQEDIPTCPSCGTTQMQNRSINESLQYTANGHVQRQ